MRSEAIIRGSRAFMRAGLMVAAVLLGIVIFVTPALAVAPDAYESDDATSQAQSLTLGAAAQQRTLWPVADADWVSFVATEGVDYVIETQNADPDYTDTVLTLYGPDGTTQLQRDDDSGGTRASRIGWRAPASGEYYVRVSGYHSGVTGSYALALLPAGSVEGTVTDFYSGAVLAGIQVELYEWVVELDDGLAIGGWDIVAATPTEADGTYRFNGVKPGVRRVGFWHAGGAYNEQYHQGATSVDSAADVQVVGGASTTVPAAMRPVRIPVKLSLTGASVCAYKTATVSGGLTDATGKVLSGRPIEIHSSSDAKTWTLAKVVYTGASGTYFYAAQPSKKTWYRAQVAQTASTASGFSSQLAITPKVALGTPVAPSSMKSGRTFRVYGTLRPQHQVGTTAVRIYRWRYVSGRWKPYGYVSAKAAADSRYSMNLKLSTRGKWRLRAYHRADSSNAATWSTRSDYVMVK